MSYSNKKGANHLTVDEQLADRRIDNVLSAHLKQIPRARIYRMIRKGEVRVNSKRVRQDYRLKLADAIRIPPIRSFAAPATHAPPVSLQEDLAARIIYQDKDLLVLNKPSGLAVHSGSRQRFGVIEILRALLPEENLQLAHRLDKATSGCLLLAKNHVALRKIQTLFQQNNIRKEYIALLKGALREQKVAIKQSLKRTGTQASDRPVRVTGDGKPSETQLVRLQNYRNTTLVKAVIETGRTHQIRVHTAHIGHPVAGDPRYGNFAFNRRLRKAGLSRMFLHAEKLSLPRPGKQGNIDLLAPLPEDLLRFLETHQ